MNLVFIHHCGDGCTYECTDVIPFEYSSVEDFQFYCLEEVRKSKEVFINQHGQKYLKDYPYLHSSNTISILEFHTSVEYIENNINHCVLTLENWFNKNKTNI